VYGISSGPNISRARNLLCHIFTEEHDAPWLWMIDTDTVFGPQTLAALIAAADPVTAPIVSGLYVSANADAEPAPVAYRLGERDGKTRWRIMHVLPEDALVAVDACGAGCLLMHRDALAKIDGGGPLRWFEETTWDGGPMGEDMTFCQRAADAGLPVHVHSGVTVGHVKAAMMTPGQRLQVLGR
jgi:GT2 family glycosyltransferase